MRVIMDDALAGNPPMLVYDCQAIVLKHCTQVRLRYHLAPLTIGSNLG